MGGVVHCLLDEFREEEKARRKIPRKIPHKVEFLKVNQTTLRFYFLISSLSFGVFFKIQFLSLIVMDNQILILSLNSTYMDSNILFEYITSPSAILHQEICMLKLQ